MATVNLQQKPAQVAGIKAAAGAANKAFGSFMPKQTPAPMQSIEPNQSVAPPQAVPTPSGVKQDISPMAEPPAVITTAKAKKKTTKNQQTLNAMIEAQKQAAEAAKQAPLPEAAPEVAVEPEPTKKIEQPVSKFEQDSLKIEKQLTDINKGIEADLQENIALIDGLTKKMNKANQFQIDAIKAQFAIRKTQMADLNKRTLRGQTLLGTRSGRQRFAAEIQTSILSAEESAGIARLAQLDAQEQSLIADAERANTSEQFRALNEKMGQLSKLNDQKRRTILDLAALAKDRNDALAKEASAARDEIVFQNDLLEQRQVQQDRASSLTAPLLLSFDEEGNLVIPSEQELFSMAEEFGIDPRVLSRDVTAEAERINKLSFEQAQAALKISRELADEERKVSKEEREKKLFPLKEQEMMAKVDELQRISSGESLSTEDRKILFDLRSQASQDPDVKGFIDIRDAFDRVKASALDPSPAGDLALIFNYMKVLDPGSTVREGEFATAENSGGVDDKIRARYNKTVNGKRLSEDQRLDFVDRAEKLFEPKKRNFEKAVDFYQGEAEAFGLPKDRVVRDFLTPEPTFQPFTDFNDFQSKATQDQMDKYNKIDTDPLFSDLSTQEIIDMINERSGVTQTSTSVKGIKDNSQVSTIMGAGTATGIEAGSGVWKPGFDFVVAGGNQKEWGRGAPVKSPFSGEVISAKMDNTGFGKQVKIKLSNGEEIWLSHLDDFNVKPGQKISAGQIVGKQGNTGNVLGTSGNELTPVEIAKGAGTHVDITIKKPKGGYLTSQEVASRLQTRLT